MLYSLVLNAQDKFHKDDQCFVDWAESVKLERGFVNILKPSLGKVDYGDVADALHKADGQVISLGDRGSVVLSFSSAIVNGEGADFAVFENANKFGKYPFLELAFVEVSSNGVDFFRFPSVSLIPHDKQKGSFENTNPSLITNLAGKNLVNYGTAFDLEDMKGVSGLNINQITHIKLIDVVGSIDESIASYDSKGNIINDPFPTPFNSSGFDLDALGVIHNQANQDHSPIVISSSVSQNLDENSPDKVIDLSTVFSDPDGDLLVYSVKRNSNESLLRATVSGHQLRLKLLANQFGEAVLTLQATANGKSVATDIHVKVNAIDDAPVVVQPMANVFVDEDAVIKAIDLSTVFSDADGDLLVYSVKRNSNESLLRATVSGHQLRLKLLANQFGEAVLTLQATANGKSVATDVNVKVNAIDDAPVVVQPMANVFVDEDAVIKAIDLSTVFSDTDGDLLVYSVKRNSNESLLRATVSGHQLRLKLLANQFGEAVLTLQATANGKSVATDVNVKVNAIDDAPVVVQPMADILVNEGDAPIKIDLNTIFSDEDNDDLSFGIKSNTDELLVDVSLTGDLLTLLFLPDMSGDAVVTILANANGKSVETSVYITVGRITSVEETEKVSFNIYPNPCADILNIIAGGEVVDCVKILDMRGRVVLVSEPNSNFYRVNINHLSSGIYVILVQMGDKRVNRRLIKN